jgi:hypothetical protein
VEGLKVNTDFGHVVSLFFLAIGVSALVFPYRVQAAALRKCKKFWGFPNPFLGWMGTRAYIWMLRICGAVFIAAALFIEVVLLFGRVPNP